jgi:RimJ/RimL family protein N-acetyltransferase
MANAISFRPLTEADFHLMGRWLREPHVAAWWPEAPDPVSVRAKYGPRVDGTEPTRVFVIEYEQRPVGWIQWYRWSDYPEHAAQLGAEPEAAGIDLAVGEREMTGTGVGSNAIWQFLNQIVFADPSIVAIVTDPQEGNGRSVRAFQKVGFTVTQTVQLPGENFRRSVVRLVRPRPGPTRSGRLTWR